MRKMLVLGAASALSFGVSAADMSWSGYGQVTAESGAGSYAPTASGTPATEGSGMKFGLDQVRFAGKVDGKKHWGKINFDADGGGALEVKDAVFGLKCPNNMFNLNAGIFKAPVGMDYNQSGSKLDITKRGYDSILAFGRMTGANLNGTLGMGVSYDLFFGNPDSSNGEAGTDNLYGARLKYDRNTFFFQAALAIDENAGAAGATKGDDNKVMDFGVRYMMDALTLKAEYITNTLGNTEKTSMYAHVGFKFRSNMEAVVRHYMNTYELSTTAAAKTESEISNTFIGLNYSLNKTARIQLNYVLVSGDDRDTATAISGNTTTTNWSAIDSVSAYSANAFLAQYQVMF